MFQFHRLLFIERLYFTPLINNHVNDKKEHPKNPNLILPVEFLVVP